MTPFTVRCHVCDRRTNDPSLSPFPPFSPDRDDGGRERGGGEVAGGRAPGAEPWMSWAGEARVIGRAHASNVIGQVMRGDTHVIGRDGSVK